MNKASVKDLQKRIDELERVIDELTETLKKEMGGPAPAWFYRREPLDRGKRGKREVRE